MRAVSAGDEAAVRTLVEKLLEAWTISSEQPVAAPAVEARGNELFEFVFPGSGATERSGIMANEFSKMFVSALLTAHDLVLRAGGSASVTDVMNSVLDRRRQIWRD